MSESADKEAHGGGHGHGDGHGHGHGSPFIQHHFDDAKHQFESGKLGIWLFLGQEILFFSALFVAYIVYRHHHPEVFAYAHKYLDVTMGAINTGVLIVSSLSAAWAVRAAQLNQQRLLVGCIVVTIACAFGFLGIKYLEYSHKAHIGTVFGKRFAPTVGPDGKEIELPGGDEGAEASAAEGAEAAAAQGTEASAAEGAEVSAAEGAEASAAEGTEAAAAEGAEAQPAEGAEAAAAEGAEAAAAEGAGASAAEGAEASAAEGAEASAAEGAEAAAAEGAEGGEAGPGHGEAARLPPPNTGMFFTIYFAMTGLHGIHVLAGILVFIWLLVRALKGHFTPEYYGPIDFAALYWHLVDLIWIFLFPLLYLIH